MVFTFPYKIKTTTYINNQFFPYTMKGMIKSYRRSIHCQTPNQLVVVVPSVDTREKAQELVGKKAVWTTPAKNEIKGEVRSAHGNSGALRVLMEKGMPGQCLGTEIQIE